MKTQLFVQYLFPRNHTVYEIMWKNAVEPDRTHNNMIRHVYFVCLVIKATDTHLEYVIRIAFARQHW